MFVAQETGDTFRVFRQAEASVKRAGSARHTRRGKARKKLSPVGRVYARFALAFPRLKNAKKRKQNKQLLFCKLKKVVEQNWCTFFARK